MMCLLNISGEWTNTRKTYGMIIYVEAAVDQLAIAKWGAVDKYWWLELEASLDIAWYRYNLL